MKVVKNQQFW